MFTKLALVVLFIAFCLSSATLQVFADQDDFGLVTIEKNERHLIVVNEGDLFWITSHVPGSVLEVMPGHKSLKTLTGVPGDKLPLQYTTPGTYRVRIFIDDQLITSGIKVRVMRNSPRLKKGQTVAPRAGTYSVGSVWAGGNTFCVRVVGSGAYDLQPYGSGTTTPRISGNLGTGGEAVWVVTTNKPSVTLIKKPSGGTHVLSVGSPYILKINNIRLKSGSASVAPGTDVAGITFSVGLNKDFTLEVIPGPGWVTNAGASADSLFKWTQDASGTGLTKLLNYSTAGEKHVTVSCATDTYGKSTTINATEVTLVAENSLTECMEGRSVTFTATANGFSSSGILTFTFHYTRADGTKWTSSDWSYDNVEDNTAVADQVPDGNMDHYFETPIYVDVEDKNGVKGTSETLQIKVYELWIKTFKDKGSNKDWKVVVGRPISYEAIASSDCTNWDWDMEDGVPDAWNPTGGDSKKGDATIPYSDLARASNSWFGEVYGTVNVFCEDGDGNNHRIYSTDLDPSVKAKVFFPKNLNVDGGTPSNDKPPCWFVFWRQSPVAVPNLDTASYDHNLGGYGESHLEDGIFYGYNQIIKVGPLASGVHYPGGININGHNFGGAEGIDCCAEVVEHERLHNAHALDRTNGAADTDSDLLPDSLEAALGCVVGNRDTFNLAVLKNPIYATYGDEEYSVMLGSDGKKGVPANDWSEGGKQW